MTATVRVEVSAESAEQAREIATRATDAIEAEAIHGYAEVGDLVEATVDEIVVAPAVFAVPPGGERWADAAREQEFGLAAACRRDWPVPPVAVTDGSAWWTDGAVMLRCDGEAPGDDVRVVHRADNMILGGIERVAATWSPSEWSPDGHVQVLVSPGLAPDKVYVDRKYIDLVERSVPGVTWHVGGPLDPVHAVEGDRVVAMVMPVRGPR